MEGALYKLDRMWYSDIASLPNSDKIHRIYTNHSNFLYEKNKNIINF